METIDEGVVPSWEKPRDPESISDFLADLFARREPALATVDLDIDDPAA